MAEFITCKITKAIGRPCADKQGGIAKLYLFAYEKYSKSLNLVSEQQVVTFPTTNAYEYEAQNMSFTESTSLKDGGVEWSQKLSFTITESNELSEIYKLANQDYSAVILDRNGNYRFIGMRNGGEVTVNAVSGTSRSEMNGYNVTISAKEDNQAYYIPDFETIFNVVVPFVFELPSVPTNLRYSQYTGGSSIDLDWDASTQGTLAIGGYYTYVNNQYYSFGSGTSIRITGLEPSTNYSLSVRAYDVDGNYSGKSNEINITTAQSGFAFRVASDFGYTESLECINI